MPNTEARKHAAQRPLVCSGHSRPVPFVHYSDSNDADADSFLMITSCLGAHDSFFFFAGFFPLLRCVGV
jgi:hypothetical protein